ncbi:hypothetical protein LWI29_016266 [Acer saccharum]|uniref:Glycine-rich protein n=1 Tax=Acer saccharum TaxID=4024 RepID=A0AA39S3D6_ACESA|nr:hypothetical protein LWI29_016266 [Acer saccharum]
MASSKTALSLIVCVLFAFVLLVSSRATPSDVRTNQDNGSYGGVPTYGGNPSPTYGGGGPGYVAGRGPGN